MSLAPCQKPLGWSRSIYAQHGVSASLKEIDFSQDCGGENYMGIYFATLPRRILGRYTDRSVPHENERPELARTTLGELPHPRAGA
jgi:hypothetical protein